MKRNRLYIALIFILVAFDQITKFLVVKNIPIHSTKTVIPSFFNLIHVQNRGAIFGFFSRSSSSWVFIVLTALSLIALGLVIFYFLKTSSSERGMKISLSLVLAGALGNLIDRIFRGFVVDFLDFIIIKWHWPTFNIADSCISIGAALLFILFFFRRR